MTLAARFASAAVLLSIFFFPPSLRAETPSRGDAFVTAAIAEPSNLLPLFASDSASAEISRLLFNGLVKYDKDLKLVGDLAAGWDVQAGGTVIVFHLRKNVVWQDGKPFTAADVEFTFRKLTDPNVPTPYGGDFEAVKSLEVLGPHVLRVTYKEPFSPGLASWSMGMLPKHLLEKEDLLKTAFARRPVGTGPYKLGKWKTGESVVLLANDRYHEGRPWIDRYVYRVIPDQATSFLELQTGGLDLAGLTPLQFRRQTDTPFFRDTYRKYSYPSFSYVYLGWNLDHPFFSDVRVREALDLSIDRKEIIAVTLLGAGRTTTGPFLPGTWAYDEAVPEPAFDPARARRLLAEAGWKDSDGDGVLEKDGKPFSFTLISNFGNDQRKQACEIVQRRLADVGIDANVRLVEWGTFLKEFIDKRRFEAVCLAWQLGRDPDVYDIFHSSKRAPGQFNFVGYSNPEVDRLLEEGRRLFGESERAAVYKKAHAILARDRPYTFLYVPDAMPVVHRRFREVEKAAAGIGHNFVRWWVPAGERRYRSLREA